MTSYDTAAQADAGGSDALLAELRQFSTPSVLNGLKRLGLKPAQMQTMSRHQIRCMAPELGPRAGIAVTRTMATHRDDRPVDGQRARELGVEFDALAASVTGPKFLAVENVGDADGPEGGFVGFDAVVRLQDGEIGLQPHLARFFVRPLNMQLQRSRLPAQREVPLQEIPPISGPPEVQLR